MWLQRDIEDLAVYADALQQRGDAWGELISTSLAHAETPAPALAERLAKLQRTLVEPTLTPILRPGVHPRFEHGVLVGLHVGGVESTKAEAAIGAATQLLRLPIARFVSRVLVTVDWDHQISICNMLLDEQSQARPRFLRMGMVRRSVRRMQLFDATRSRGPAGPGFHGGDGPKLADPERGLIELSLFDGRFELPWARGDGGSRLAAMRRLADRIVGCAGVLPPRERMLLGRAMGDRSLRVRLATLELLPALGREAAMFVPSLVGAHNEDARWQARAHEVLAQLAAQDDVVDAVLDNVEVEHLAVLDWLEQIGAVDDRLLDRVALLLEPRWALPGWLVVALQGFLRRHRPVLPKAPAEIESEDGWFARLRAWLRG